MDRASYVLGPGDRVAISFLGTILATQETFVTAEGTLIAPPAVGVPVSGLTVDAAESALAAALGEYYHGVQVRLNLVEVRRFQVYALGAVLRPGMYEANGTIRVSGVLDRAGGILQYGSVRAIRVERAEGDTLRADILRFLISGDNRANPLLRDGDRVVVPIAGEKASVRGLVGLPGDLEVLPGETLEDMILLAGGIRPGADRTRVVIRRFLAPSAAETQSIEIDLDSGGSETPIIPGDQINVYGIPEWHVRRVVSVRGEVQFPGEYVIDEGKETLAGVIQRAGGLTPDASVHQMTLTRTIGEEVIDPEFERLKRIEVGDMTRNEYEYFKLRSREHRGRVVVVFDSLFIAGKASEDVLVRRGDIVDVPIATRSVKVSGQVAAPGAIAYEPGKPVRWYIDRAGGYGWRASQGKTRVIRARTGEWQSAKQVKDLEAGDTIWVPEKPERDYWDIFKEGLLIAAQVATIWLVIDTAGNE